MEMGHQAGRGQEGVRVFRVDAALDRVALQHHVRLPDRQLVAGGDQQLLADQVDAGHQLGHRVLDLDACVHLDEIEAARLVQELEGAGAAVADAQMQASTQTADLGALLGVMPGAGASSTTFWWRRCIEQSRSPRWMAFPGRRPAPGSPLPRVLQELLHVHHVVAERRLASRLVVAMALASAASVCTTRMPRPPPPPAALTITG